MDIRVRETWYRVRLRVDDDPRDGMTFTVQVERPHQCTRCGCRDVWTAGHVRETRPDIDVAEHPWKGAVHASDTVQEFPTIQEAVRWVVSCSVPPVP